MPENQPYGQALCFQISPAVSLTVTMPCGDGTPSRFVAILVEERMEPGKDLAAYDLILRDVILETVAACQGGLSDAQMEQARTDIGAAIAYMRTKPTFPVHDFFAGNMRLQIIGNYCALDMGRNGLTCMGGWVA